MLSKRSTCIIHYTFEELGFNLALFLFYGADGIHYSWLHGPKWKSKTIINAMILCHSNLVNYNPRPAVTLANLSVRNPKTLIY